MHLHWKADDVGNLRVALNALVQGVPHASVASQVRSTHVAWVGALRDVGCGPDSRQHVKHWETSVWASRRHGARQAKDFLPVYKFALPRLNRQSVVLNPPTSS